MTVEQALESLRENRSAPAAWEKIADEAYQPLLVYVASLLLTFRVAPGESAHDVVHNVMINFYERWPTSRASIHSADDLQAYLRRSCRNYLIDRYRREQTAAKLVDFLALKYSHDSGEGSDSERSILTSEIIARLSAECASLFRQYVAEDLSPAEIADHVGAPAATFYSRWHRCLQKAREIFLQRKSDLSR